MSYQYKDIEVIIKTLNLNRGPFVGPALCDAVQGDPDRKIPQDIIGYHIPEFKRVMGFPEKEYPFFAELQPEIPWIQPDTAFNAQNPWSQFCGIPLNSRMGLHLPISVFKKGVSPERQVELFISNRKACIDFGEKRGVMYYVLHIANENFHQNHTVVKEILRKTIAYLCEIKTNSFILIENLEYPGYPSTPQELYWWFHRLKELAGSVPVKIGVMMDVSHLWRTRGEIIKAMREGRALPEWITAEKDIIHQPYHDFLNYTLKTKLDGIPVIGFHVGGCYGNETHLIPGVQVGHDPETTPAEINRFYDENVEMNMKTTLKNIVQYYFDSYREAGDIHQEFRPLYIVTESYISYYNRQLQPLTYSSVLKGTRAVRDYLLQYYRKLLDKSLGRVRFYEYLSASAEDPSLHRE